MKVAVVSALALPQFLCGFEQVRTGSILQPLRLLGAVFNSPQKHLYFNQATSMCLLFILKNKKQQFSRQYLLY